MIDADSLWLATIPYEMHELILRKFELISGELISWELISWEWFRETITVWSARPYGETNHLVHGRVVLYIMHVQENICE